MVRSEYETFLTELNSQGVTEDVKRLANIILNNFEDLLPLGTGRSQRARLLTRVARRELDSTSADLPSSGEATGDVDFPINRLTQLTVGPFRGFSEEENFDLDSSVVLIYGPNGSGKSSFCEALEYALLGSVEEAEVKRLEAGEYLINARVGAFDQPILAGNDSSSNPVDIVPDEELYRFCFIEKNRIDDFSRIAAKTPAHQNRLIATLFGLGEFDEFVKGFSAEIKFLDVVGEGRVRLREKRALLHRDEEVVANEKSTKDELAQEEQKLADNIESGMKYEDFVAYLGFADKPGRIQEIEDILAAPIPIALGITKTGIEDVKDQAKVLSAAVTQYQEQLNGLKNEVSFRDLYQAVTDLKEVSPDNCPACNTPLLGDISVVINPFDRASEGLNGLAHLADLEQKCEEVIESEKNMSGDLLSLINRIIAFAKEHGHKSDCIENIEQVIPDDAKDLDFCWWDDLFDVFDADVAYWDVLLDVVSNIEDHNIKVSEDEVLRTELMEESRRLQELREDVVRRKQIRKDTDEKIAEAKASIETFEVQNRALIGLVETERDSVALNIRIDTAYNVLVASLYDYRDQLPARLLANLAETTKEFYNGFNREDHPGDLIVDLRLPLANGQKIEVAYASDSETYFDALHVMSEGHIRCLGLAILLAKNITLGCPFLLFDDPVNAIDEDHRSGIRKTLFEDDWFNNKQILLACHGEEFFKDVQNLIGADQAREGKFFTFLPHRGDNQIIVDSEPSPRNYVIEAQEHLAKGEIRNALASARRGTENVCARIWKFMANRGHGELNIKLRSSNSTPELWNVINQLNSKVGKAAFVNEKKEGLLNGLAGLIGIGAESREWTYLNGGTHEGVDRVEFDRSRVNDIVDALTLLDATMSA